MKRNLVLAAAAMVCMASTARAQDLYLSQSGNVGTVAGNAHIGVDSQFNRNAGVVGSIGAGDSVSGFVSVYENASLNMTGGYVGGNLLVLDRASTIVSGGTVDKVIYNGGSSGSVTGGYIGQLDVENGVVISVRGGNRNAMYTSNDGIIDWRGGGVYHAIYVGGNTLGVGGFDVWGSGLALSQVEVVPSLNWWQLTGTLEDGTALQNWVFGDVTGVRLHNTAAPTGAVPEPGEWAAMGILGLGLGGLVIRGRRRVIG